MQVFLDTNPAIQAFFSFHLFLEILILLLQLFRQSKYDTIICSQSISIDCVKSVCIRGYSGPYFPVFGLNMFKCGKMRPRITLNKDTFYAIITMTNIEEIPEAAAHIMLCSCSEILFQVVKEHLCLAPFPIKVQAVSLYFYQKGTLAELFSEKGFPCLIVFFYLLLSIFLPIKVTNP